ncbi:hypothetical protein BN1708_020194, partial [Verticillium longisporum]
PQIRRVQAQCHGPASGACRPQGCENLCSTDTRDAGPAEDRLRAAQCRHLQQRRGAWSSWIQVVRVLHRQSSFTTLPAAPI